MGNIASQFSCCSSLQWLETSKEQHRIANKDKNSSSKPEIAVTKKSNGKISISAEQWSIPLDIIMEILSWLPVKYVLRMKCVCKQWYALTQDCQFIEKHMSQVTNITRFYNTCPVRSAPSGSGREIFQLICGCNGLLLSKSNASGKYYIANHATRQILGLPDPRKNSFGMTFSFVPSSGYYKLVSVYDDNEEAGIEGCEILTIGSDNSWRTLNLPNLKNANKKREKIMIVLAGEAVHCIRVNKVRTCFCTEIVSLDLENESFNSNIMPQGLFSDWEKVWALDWNGSLSFAFRVEEAINVMVLEDYKKLKWGKEIIVVPLAFMNSTSDLMENPVPLLTRSGDLWFRVKDKKLMAYNIESKKISHTIAATKRSKISNCAVYIGPSSLITLKGMQPGEITTNGLQKFRF
ncbi:putative F-box protein At3g10240 [Castanea sativa]|uniref:putative F-box protein At3g10240 n=1 Tax=Castanea sativa TaxID=21020 RepID=UPI003F64F061